MKSPIALLRSLLNDYKRLNPGVKGLERDLVTLEKRFENEGFGFLTKALPALDEALLLGLSSGKFTCPVGFKPLKRGTIPRLASGMFSEVFDPFTGTLRETPDLGVLKCLHGMLRLFKKTLLTAEDEDILHQKAVNEFYQCDERASRVIIPDRHDHLIGRVCKILLNNLNSKEVENATYKHGPGAVFEGYKANEKFSALWKAVRSDSDLLRECGIYGTFTTSVADVSVPRTPSNFQRNIPDHEQSGTTPGGRCLRPTATYLLTKGEQAVLDDSCYAGKDPGPKEEDSFESDRASGSSARLISVAKNSTSRRTITVEPLLRQYVQQGLNTLLRDSISECRVLRNCIALTDQSKNQVLALEGSLLDNWATIDLKSASDLLSVSLVRSVFRHNARFLERMMECRSSQVECSNQAPLALGKFAGMGNALTFPVQSICFAVVCIAAILDQAGRTPTYWNVRRASRCIRVYGDDIIIKREYAHQCVDWLHAVGLAVNGKKSFLEGNFKESCGVDAFGGVDITPLYVKHYPDLAAASPNVIAHFVELSNHMWMDCLYAASTWLKEQVEMAIRSPLPLVSRSSGSFGWVSRQDAMTPHKWCKRTHKFLTRTYALSSLKRKDRIDGYPALLKCLSQPGPNVLEENAKRKLARKSERNLFPEPLARETDHLERTVIRYKSRMCRRWVPTLVSDGLNLTALTP
jgi:hypothetical protein